MTPSNIDQLKPRSDSCPHNSAVSCGDCRLNTICLPLALEHAEVVELDEIVQRGRPVQKNAHIYREAGDFAAIYAVRSGSIKTYQINDEGKEQVTGFYFPGEVFGIDGISNHTYRSSAKAMETATVCEIPFERLEELSTKIPSLQHHFFQLMSQAIVQDQLLITLLSKNSADERVAALLMSISARNKRRKLSATSFRLPMSRIDIGNFLGLTVETVSRVFSRFQQSDILSVDNKEITIKNIESLQKLLNGAQVEIVDQ